MQVILPQIKYSDTHLIAGSAHLLNVKHVIKNYATGALLHLENKIKQTPSLYSSVLKSISPYPVVLLQYIG